MVKKYKEGLMNHEKVKVKTRFLLFMLVFTVLTFSVWPDNVGQDGSYNYKIPIDILPGTHGMAPKLSISYNSNGGDGMLGVGWYISGISFITRDKSRGYSNHYMYKGQRLYPTSDGLYHTERENYEKIRGYNLTSGNSYWKVADKNGTIKYYGSTQDSRYYFGPGLQARSWALNKVEDVFGNYYVIKYFQDVYTGEFYVDRIVYTMNDANPPGAYRAVQFIYEDRPDKKVIYTPSKATLNKRLKYIRVLIGTDINGNGGVVVREYVLTYKQGLSTGKSILYSVQLQNPASPDEKYPPITFEWYGGRTGEYLYKDYIATFVNNSDEGAEIDVSRIKFGDFNGDGRSDIYQVRGWGTSEADRIYLTGAVPGQYTTIDGPVTYVGNSYNGAKVDISRIKFADFNGDGKTDIYVVKGWGTTETDEIWLSDGISFHNQAGLSTRVRGDYNGAMADIASIIPADFNRDGMTDIYQVLDSSYGTVKDKIWLAQGNGGFGSINWGVTWDGIYSDVSYNPVQAVNDISRIRFGDFNGDARIDIYLIRGSSTTENDYIYFGQIGGGFKGPLSGPATWINTDSIDAEAVDISRIKLGDFNGDGLTDVYQINGWGSWQVDNIFINTNKGFLRHDGLNTWVSNTTADAKVDISRIKLGDFNGDGLTDVYYVRGWGAVKTDDLFLFNGDLTYKRVNGAPTWVSNTTARAGVDTNRVRFGDFDGDGISDIYRINGWGSSVADGMWVNSSEKEIVHSINNGRGGSEVIYYREATNVPDAVKPLIGENTLPPGLYLIPPPPGSWSTLRIVPTKTSRRLVTKVILKSGQNLAKSTEYSYYNGLTYAGEMENTRNLGFEWRIIKDVGSGAYTKIYYNQNIILNGLISKIETYDSQNKLYSRVINKYAYREDDENYPEIKFIYKVLKKTENFNGSTDTPVSGKIEYSDYDDYGNCTKIVNYGDMSTSEDDVTTLVDYSTINTLDADFNGSYISKLFRKRTYGYDRDNIWGLATENRIYYDNMPLGSIGSKGLVTKTEAVNGSDLISSVFEYDSYGNNIKYYDPRANAGEYNGYTTKTDYDPVYHSYIISVTDALGYTSYTEYDSFMRPYKSIDINGAVNRIIYNGLGDIVKIINEGDTEAYPTVEITYNYTDTTAPTCIIKKIKGSNDSEYIYNYTYYDGLGRVIQKKTEAERTGSYRTVDIYYDSSGRAYKKSVPYIWYGTPSNTDTTRDPLQKYTLTEYDAAGRIHKVIKPDGTYTLTIYNKNSTIKVDAEKHVTEVEVNGRKKYTKEYTGEYPNQMLYATTTTENYRGGSRITDDQGNTIVTYLDMLGRKYKMEDPNMGTWTFTYDANGNKKSQTDAKGVTIRYIYDKLNRITKIDYPSGQDTYFYYDEAGHGYSKGRLTREVYGEGSKSNSYDIRGRVTESTMIIDGMSRTEYFTYNAANKVASITYPDGEIIYNTYNNDGSLQMVKNKDQAYVYSMSYNAFGKLVSMTYGNGRLTQYDYYDKATEYDASAGTYYSYRLRRITNSLAGSQNVTYEYDKVGNVIKQIDPTSDIPEVSYNQNFGYDELNRLVYASGTEVNYYSYDSIGNIIQKDDQTYEYASSKPYAVTKKGNWTFGYDANGNMVSGYGREYVYDYNNMLIQVKINGSVRGAYSYFGNRRVKKIEEKFEPPATVTTRYFFPNYEEEDNNGSTNIIKYYYANGMRIAKRSSKNGLSYIHSDHLGSTSRVTAPNGGEIARYEYKPYGTTFYQKSGNEKYKFNGKEQDISGFYYYGARYYDPYLGRFTSPDTIIQGDSQGINRYAYCANNPVRYTDPTGNFKLSDITPWNDKWAGDVVEHYEHEIGDTFEDVWNFTADSTSWVFDDVLGIESINVSFFNVVGFEVGIDFAGGNVSIGVGVGAGFNIGVNGSSYGAEGKATIGYDTATDSIYVSAGGTYGVVSINARFYFRSSDYYITTSASAYGITTTVSYSSVGGFSYGANVGYGNFNAGWNSRGGFRVGIDAGMSGRTDCGGTYSSNIGYNYDFSTGRISGQISTDVMNVCFTAGTKVAVEGGEKNIEDIKAGDMVLAKSIDTGEVGYKRVERTFVRQTDKIVRLDLGDEVIEVTPEHPFWVVINDIASINKAEKNGKWIKAGKLKEGMRLLNADGKIVNVKDKTVEQRNETVYNLETRDWHTYFVGNNKVLVHNICGPPNVFDDPIGASIWTIEALISLGGIASGMPVFVAGGIGGITSLLFCGDSVDWAAASITGGALSWLGRSAIAVGISNEYVTIMMAEVNFARTYGLSRLAGKDPYAATRAALATAPLGIVFSGINVRFNYNPTVQKILGITNGLYQQYFIQSDKQK